MAIGQLIEALADAGVFLAVQEGKLVCKAREGALTAERRRLIGERKAEFIAFLAGTDIVSTDVAGDDGPALVPRPAEAAVLSPTQRRLWFLDRLTGAIYTVPVTLRLSGVLDADALGRALRRIVERHRILRTLIQPHEGEPVAVVRDDLALALEQESFETLAAPAQEREVRARLQATLADPFDLAHELPLRARLFRFGAQAHVLMLTFHHIAVDGWSVENLLRELSALYAAFAGGKPDPLPPLSLQFADYAAWQRDRLRGERLRKPLDYWRERLAGAPVVHGLPLDRPRPADVARIGASWRQRLPATLHQSLVELGRRHGATLFMTLQAAFAVLVARWSGESDVVIGTPVANRPRQELAPLIGFFANTLALRTTVAGDATFADVLRETRRHVLDAFAFQHLPFETLVETLNPVRSVNIAPLVQIMFSLQDIDEGAALNLPGIAVETLLPDSVSAKFDLNLNLFENADGLEACWDYSAELFLPETVASIGASFRALLEGIVAAPSQRIADLPLLDEAERRRVLALGDGGVQAYPDTTCLHELIERQAARATDAVAVTQESHSLTYGELNQAANRLARRLRRLGVAPDVRVAIVMDRSPAQITGLLAILKAGGAYVPMEPDYPAERLRWLLADSAPRVVITQGTAAPGLRERLAGIPELAGVRVIDIDNDTADWADEDGGNLPAAQIGLAASHLAYVIYTSGSTGRPKGVMNEHRGIVNRLLWMQDAFPHAPHDKVLQKTPIGFDVSVREIFLTLLAGAQLVLARPEGHKDPAYLVDLIRRERITVIGFVPSMLQAFLEHPLAADCDGVTRIFSGGETLPAALVRRCRERFPRARLHNLYGPTEAAVSVTAWDCPEGALPDIVPIGRPGANVRLYLLDENGRPVPRGMRGEIHIAGRQVARGYLHRPELTAERFVRDPFAGSGDRDARMYRSGDVGRQRPDGHVEFLGRNDFQVKIRGQRVELGEIEAQIQGHPGIRQAAVVAFDGPGGLQLAAYIVHDDESATDATLAALRTHLAAQLPAHMIPTAYVSMDSLPVTANGKLDAKALPDPLAGTTTADHVPPQTPLERELVPMWQALLERGPIGVTDNFFDLGGHSLLLTRLHNQVGARFGVELPLRDLFAAQTVREQARLIEPLRQEGGATDPLAPSPRPAGAPDVLSFAQQRLWFIDQMGDAGAVYNIPCALRLQGVLDTHVLRQCLQSIVERHEVLRTPLPAVNGTAKPRRIDNPHVALPIDDLSMLDDATRRDVLRQRLDAEAALPFDLGADLFLRARLLRLAAAEHVLMLTVHHIAADGWSMAVLLQELATLYDAAVLRHGKPLPDLPLQYADYAHWQQQWLQGARLEVQLDYWQRQLANLPVLHNLPLDFPRPDTQHYRGAMHVQRMPAALLSDLRRLARAHDATLFMTMQAAFAVLLARWSGDTDIVMGTPIANRRHEQLSPLIGFFVNTLVLRTDLSANPTFIESLHAARVMALDAFQHQDLPFEMLVDRLRPQRSTSHSPLFQVMLALDNNTSAIVPFGGLAVTDAATDSQHAKFDLTLNLRETPDGLEAWWDYNRDLFRADTVARIAASFRALLEGIVAAPDRRVQQLPLLGADDASLRWQHGECRDPMPVTGVHELVEATARSAPHAVAAVDDEHGSLGYAELDRRANRLAHALVAHGVVPDARVAIHAARGVDVVVAALAVLKAGGAYVPLDPAHPRERLAAMIEDCGAQMLLTQRHLRDALPMPGVHALAIDDDAFLSDGNDEAPHVPGLRGHHLAYVIYTSGSTGTPKGAMVEHAGLVNMIADTGRLFADDKPVRAAWWASFGFDASVFEMFTALALGAALHVVPEDVRADADAWLAWLTRHRITQAYLPPFFVRHLRGRPDREIAALSLRRILVGVESLAEDELHRLRRLLPDLLILNAYGPTEATVYATAYTDVRDLPRNAPIGRPIANTRVTVLDDALQPVPTGVVGEIHIAGVGVARGYLGRADLTAERFVHDTAGARWYRTGDLARWLPEGQLEFRGRRDQQIKLHGVRIEPGEIEAVLCTHPAVDETAVIVRQDAGADSRQLVAYVVTREESTVAPDDLREFLTLRLPAYMVPAAFVNLPAIPLTVSGKRDTRALPAPGTHAYSVSEHVPPATPLEERIAALWRELLQHERVSVTANFFDLGGHSLNAVQLMSGIREAIGKALPISILFKAPTVRALAAQVETYGNAADESFVVLREGGNAPPLFVFHAAGGDVLCYQPMLQYLAPGMPVYGFHRRELPNQRVPAFTSTEQLADEYVARLLQQQPQGPYRLAGWSSGGLLAMEAAARLEALGHTVAVVALIDTMLATGTDLPAAFHERGLPALQRLDAQQACDLMREYEPALPPVTPRDGVLDVSAKDYFDYLVAANQISLDFHRPAFSLRARVHYFGCSRNRNFKTPEQRIGEIQALVQQGISREDFDATHFSIMEEPDVAGLGRAMAKLLAADHAPALTTGASAPHHDLASTA